MAIGLLYGDVQFQLLFVIGIKARYMAIIYALVAVAMISAACACTPSHKLAERWAALPSSAWRRGVEFVPAERKMVGLRNGYYRWKRRRAAKKFEVYMRSQGRTVKFDGSGKQIDEDHEDRSAGIEAAISLISAAL